MRSINKVILLGNLTRDPEIKKTLNNQTVATFGLATNREWITKDGRKEKSSEFHDLVCWGRLAEIAGQYLRKGKPVYVEGYLKTRSWDDATGIKKFRTEIVVNDLIMVEKREHNDEISTVPSEEHYAPTAGSHADTQAHESFQPSVTIESPFTI